MMFKVLVLQTLYTLSDDQTEYQLKDRLSFMRFVGLALHDPVPDAKTIWLFREQLARAGAAERLFARFDALLRAKGWLAMGGQIVDATVIEARRPRLTQAEKDTLKGGGMPAENLALLERRGLRPQFQRKKPRGKPIPAHLIRGNVTRARVRSRVEHVFAAQKCRLGLVVRTVGMMRDRVKIGLANLAYNFSRLAWLQAQTAPA